MTAIHKRGKLSKVLLILDRLVSSGKFNTVLFAQVRGLTREVQHHGHVITAHKSARPNRSFNVDANKGHAFGIFMALIGALRASRSGAS